MPGGRDRTTSATEGASGAVRSARRLSFSQSHAVTFLCGIRAGHRRTHRRGQRARPGAPPSQRIGHADIGVTLKVYAHVLPGDDEDAALRADALLENL